MVLHLLFQPKPTPLNPSPLPSAVYSQPPSSPLLFLSINLHSFWTKALSSAHLLPPASNAWILGFYWFPKPTALWLSWPSLSTTVTFACSDI